MIKLFFFSIMIIKYINITQGYLNFRREIYKLEAILSHSQLQLYISIYSPLESRRQRFAAHHNNLADPHSNSPHDPSNSAQQDQEPSIDMTSFLNVFEFQLQNDPARPDILKLYIFRQAPPDEFKDWGLLYRDKENGLWYLELVFRKREEKEAFYVTHRLVHALSRIDVFSVIGRLEGLGKEGNKSKIFIQKRFLSIYFCQLSYIIF